MLFSACGDRVAKDKFRFATESERKAAKTGDIASANTASDTTSIDAQTPDAQAPDAQTPDAQTPDAQTQDAQTPDAHTPDAQAQDAQAADATTGDALADSAAAADAMDEKDAGVTADTSQPDIPAPLDTGATDTATPEDAGIADGGPVNNQDADGDPSDVAAIDTGSVQDAGAAADAAGGTDTGKTDTGPAPDTSGLCAGKADGFACGATQGCVARTCKKGQCENTPHKGACDDNKPCTVNDSCKTGECKGTPKDCDDKKVCTNDTCDPKMNGMCRYKPASGPCEDGNPCTLLDQCHQGKCKAVGKNKDCDDNNACTVDSCDPKIKGANPSCVNKADATQQGKTCGSGKTCKSGVCTGGCKSAAECDDGNACTADGCANNLCINNAKSGPCDDGQKCTSAGTCSNKTCKAGKAKWWLRDVTTSEASQGLVAMAHKPSGGLVFIGTTQTTKNDREFSALHTDDYGKTTKVVTYGGPGQHQAHGMEMGPAGDMYLCGNANVPGKTANWDPWIAHIKADGSVDWTAMPGTSANAWCRRARRFHGGVFAFGNREMGAGNAKSRDLTLRRFDTSGKQQWLQVYDVAGTQTYDYARDLAVAADADPVMCSISYFGNDTTGHYDATLVKVDGSNGKKLWTKRLSSQGNRHDYCFVVIPRASNRVMMAGAKAMTGKKLGLWLVEVDDQGKQKWDKLMDPMANIVAEGLHPAPHGGLYYLGAEQKTGGLLVGVFGELDLAGNWLTKRTYTGAKQVYARAGALMPDGGIAMFMYQVPSNSQWKIARASPWGHRSCSGSGKCAEPKTVGCSDGNGCTYDSCGNTSGCKNTTFLPATSPCEDGNPCTVGQACVAIPQKKTQCGGGGKRLFYTTVTGTKNETHGMAELADGSIAWVGTHNNTARLRHVLPGGKVNKQSDFKEGTGTGFSDVVVDSGGRLVACGAYTAGGGGKYARLTWFDSHFKPALKKDYRIGNKDSYCSAVHARPGGLLAFMGRRDTPRWGAYYHLVDATGEHKGSRNFDHATDSISPAGFAPSSDGKEYLLFGGRGTAAKGYAHWIAAVKASGVVSLDQKTTFSAIQGTASSYQRYGGAVGYKGDWVLTGQFVHSTGLRSFVERLDKTGKRKWLQDVTGVAKADFRGLVIGAQGDRFIASGVSSFGAGTAIRLLTVDEFGKNKHSTHIGVGTSFEVFRSKLTKDGDTLIAAAKHAPASSGADALEIRADALGKTTCK